MRPYHHKMEENVFSFLILSIAAGWCLTLCGHVDILIEPLKHVSASVTTAQTTLHYITLQHYIYWLVSFLCPYSVVIDERRFRQFLAVTSRK